MVRVDVALPSSQDVFYFRDSFLSVVYLRVKDARLDFARVQV